MNKNENRACSVPDMTDTEQAIFKGAKIIAQGGIGAFPTETVYGLGGDATNPEAVARIYQAKGRPGDNPLILHIVDKADFAKLADNPPNYAMALIDAYWPGPMTLVAKKKPHLPPWLGGHPERAADTIGIRMPSHPIALAIIKASGCFVAAPSANKAGIPSPTLAQHVESDFTNSEIDFIVDGGQVPGGLESTVVDVTGAVPVILRPGAITPKMVEEATGLKISENLTEADTPRAPGMKYRHYAPKAPMTVIIGDDEHIASYILAHASCKDGILVTTQVRAKLGNCYGEIIELGSSHEEVSYNLYASLRRFDRLGVEKIYAQGFVEEGLGAAIMDRMKKAAEGRIIHVTE
ncbi:MAG: L-threonylcarbamoyladenylate synthase [Defluviitaleaceae bacterium]|nr:L-threonylcarbamoyladenylate synthase [Defluviitaleaceae bacterium]